MYPHPSPRTKLCWNRWCLLNTRGSGPMWNRQTEHHAEMKDRASSSLLGCTQDLSGKTGRLSVRFVSLELPRTTDDCTLLFYPHVSTCFMHSVCHAVNQLLRESPTWNISTTFGATDWLDHMSSEILDWLHSSQQMISIDFSAPSLGQTSTLCSAWPDTCTSKSITLTVSCILGSLVASSANPRMQTSYLYTLSISLFIVRMWAFS